MIVTRELVRSAFPVSRLGDLVEFLDHKRRPVKESERNPGPYPYYGANSQQGWIDRYIFDEPLILMAEDGGHFDNPRRGIAYAIQGKTWVNNHAHVLRPIHSKIDAQYLLNVLKNYDIRPFVSGTTRGKLTKAQAERIEIPLPPLDEQRRIAAILDKADALSRKRKRALDLLDGLTQSIFLEVFGDPTANNLNFNLKNLEDIVGAVVDCPHSTPTWTEAGKIALRTSNLTAGDWNWSDTRYVTEAEYHARSARAYVRPGDIVLSREGTVGVAAIVQPGMEVCLGQRLVQINMQNASVESEYLLAYLLHKLAPKRISRIMVGATSTHLNLKELRKMQVPVPPLDLQENYGKRVARIGELKQRVRESSCATALLYRSLQHRAFTGQL